MLGIQIVSFDWPWPANYGGIIDVYYRIEELLLRGVHVRLHVVAREDRSADVPLHWRQAGIEVFSHLRRGPWSALLPRPYIVGSRAVGSLLPNLVNGAGVLLFEGVHCTGWLAHPRLGNKVQWVRVHNRESEYYEQLSLSPTTALRRLYYREEARRLRSYEARVLAQADLLLPVSPHDEAWCESLHSGGVLLHRSYVGPSKVDLALGCGEYALFHAALHVDDNETSARQLIALLEHRPAYRLIVAGRTPSAGLRAFAKTFTNVNIVADPSTAEMHALIRGAQVVLLRANHNAGYKIKLIESLAMARHVIANAAMVHGAPGLAAAVAVVETQEEWLAALDRCWTAETSETDQHHRSQLLAPYLRGALADRLVEKIREATFTKN